MKKTVNEIEQNLITYTQYKCLADIQFNEMFEKFNDKPIIYK